MQKSWDLSRKAPGVDLGVQSPNSISLTSAPGYLRGVRDDRVTE